MNKLAIIFAFLLLAALPFVTATSISNCSTTISASGYYILTNDIGPPISANCLTYTVGNFVLDCNGRTITLNGTSKIAVFTSGSALGNITMKNCIVDGATASIGFESTTNSGGKPFYIENNIFNKAPVVLAASNNGRIIGNTFRNGSLGLSFNNVRYYTITENQFLSNTNDIAEVTNPNYNNTISNNLFNGTNTITTSGNFWTGNTWTTPTGSGFSDICIDADSDSVCDAPYQVINNDYDTAPVRLNTQSNPNYNAPPNTTITFLGTDPAKQVFHFQVGMTDWEGGNTYYAQMVAKRGEITVGTPSSFNIVVNFDGIANKTINGQRVASDLGLVTEYPYNCAVPNISRSSPFSGFNIDGVLAVGKVSCSDSTVVMFPSPALTPAVSAADTNTTVLKVEFMGVPSGGDAANTGVTVLDYNGRSLSYVLFTIPNDRSNVSVGYFNGSVVVPGGSHSFSNTSWLVVTETIHFDTQTSNVLVQNEAGVSLASFAVPFYTVGATTVQSVELDSTSIGDKVLYVNYVSLSYQSASFNYPQYAAFDEVQPYTPLYLYISPFIPASQIFSPYGQYEIYLWATDDAHGQSYYGTPTILNFTYNTITPTLTTEELRTLMATANGNLNTTGTGTGDIVTDKLRRLWESLGFKSVASKALLALFLLVALTIILSSLTSEVIILLDMVGLVVLAYIGLLPAWFVAIIIILAAAFVAMAIRKATTGQG